MELGTIVFLRLDLSSVDSYVVKPLPRASKGAVSKTRGRRPLWVQFECGSVVACREEWLEPSPGKFACALANASPDEFYSHGMIITDVVYPSSSDVHFPRWQTNAKRAAMTWPGTEVWTSDTIDVMNLEAGLAKRHIDINSLGLVLCEQPNAPGEDQCDLHHRIILSWLAQLKDSTVGVLVIRDWCARRLKAKFTGNYANMPKRMSIHDIDMHYEPIRNTDKYATSDGWHVGDKETTWKAVVVRGELAPLVEVPGRIIIPMLVWHTVVSGKRTLQTACYTCESSVVICDFVQKQLTLYGLAASSKH